MTLSVMMAAVPPIVSANTASKYGGAATAGRASTGDAYPTKTEDPQQS